MEILSQDENQDTVGLVDSRLQDRKGLSSDKQVGRRQVGIGILLLLLDRCFHKHGLPDIYHRTRYQGYLGWVL